MPTSLIVLAAAVSGWTYVPRSDAMTGGGPAAVRTAPAGEPAVITCDRRTAQVLIAGGPADARSARLRSNGAERWVRMERNSGGGGYLPVFAGAMVLDGVVDGRWPLTVSYDGGTRLTLAPATAVTRVVRECRSLSPGLLPLGWPR